MGKRRSQVWILGCLVLIGPVLFFLFRVREEPPEVGPPENYSIKAPPDSHAGHAGGPGCDINWRPPR